MNKDLIKLEYLKVCSQIEGLEALRVALWELMEGDEDEV